MGTGTVNKPLRLMEIFRSVFYTPIYVAVSGGFFEQEGLYVEFSACPGGWRGPEYVRALNTGETDIAQSGPMRSIIAADQGAEVVPSHIIEINSRDGFFLVGRVPQDRFSWNDLKGSTLIPVGFSPMPKASLQYALRKKGVDLRELHLLDGLSLDQSMETFRSGEGDFIQLLQPAVEQLVDEGTGHVVVALGPITGHIAYTSFATTQRFLDSNSEVVQRFTQGFYNAQKWLAQNEPQSIAELVKPFFPEIDTRLISGAIARYQGQDTWAKDPLFREDGFDTLQEVLAQAGLINSRQSYTRIVRPDFARKAMEEG